MAQLEDHYRVLGVERTATAKQIRDAWLKLSLKYHPDKNHAPDATEKSQRINDAYEVLKDQFARAAYDAKLDAEARAARGRPHPNPHAFDPRPRPRHAAPRHQAEQCFHRDHTQRPSPFSSSSSVPAPSDFGKHTFEPDFEGLREWLRSDPNPKWSGRNDRRARSQQWWNWADVLRSRDAWEKQQAFSAGPSPRGREADAHFPPVPTEEEDYLHRARRRPPAPLRTDELFGHRPFGAGEPIIPAPSFIVDLEDMVINITPSLGAWLGPPPPPPPPPRRGYPAPPMRAPSVSPPGSMPTTPPMGPTYPMGSAPTMAPPPPPRTPRSRSYAPRAMPTPSMPVPGHGWGWRVPRASGPLRAPGAQPPPNLYPEEAAFFEDPFCFYEPNPNRYPNSREGVIWGIPNPFGRRRHGVMLAPNHVR